MVLDIVAAGYATWRLHASRAIDWRLLASAGSTSLPVSFFGNLVVLTARSLHADRMHTSLLS